MNQWTPNGIPDLRGKMAIITGATSGLGFETARVLAARNAHIILACRNLEKGRQAQAQIKAGVPEASLAAIRRFAADVQQRHTRLDLLFNNAGLMAIPRQETQDGFEMQFGVNHLGHFALTGLLLPLLLTASASRVITTTSLARSMGTIRFDDLQHQNAYRRWGSYGQSKRANLLFSFELQRRLSLAGAQTISVAAHQCQYDRLWRLAGTALLCNTVALDEPNRQDGRSPPIVCGSRSFSGGR
jgi:protochlorophyllide reductase